MRLSDQPALQRIDATYSLPFLSACAAALNDQGLLSELDSDALRLSLKERHRRIGEGEASLFSELLAEGSPLLTLMQARCGAQGLSQLFLAWTAAQVLEQSRGLLEALAEGLLKKAELMFNQVFLLYRGEVCERRTFFSFFLVDHAEHMHEASQTFKQLIAELKVLYPLIPRGSEIGLAWEKSLALHLGFRNGQGEGVSEMKLDHAIKQLYLQLELIGDRIARITDQLAHNLNASQAIDRMHLYLEDWRGQLSQIRSTPLLGPGSLERLEIKRLRLLASLLGLNEILSLQQATLLEVLKTSSIKLKPHPLWPESERREVLACLLSQGTAHHDADMAVSALESYCHQHQVAPQQLLSTELHRIHSSLNEGFLQILKKLAMDGEIGLQLIQEKQTVLQRKNHLLRIIQGKVSQLTPLLLGTTIWLGGCGVKTTPHSEILDLKPSVPYHAEQRSSSLKRPPIDTPVDSKAKTIEKAASPPR